MLQRCAGLNKNHKLMCNIMCFNATVSDLYNLLLLLLLVVVVVVVVVTSIELSLSGSSPYTSTDKQIRINIHK